MRKRFVEAFRDNQEHRTQTIGEPISEMETFLSVEDALKEEKNRKF